MSDATHVPQDLLSHAAFVRRIARSLLADAHAAEDVVQDTLHRSLERPPAREGDRFGWLARVTRNFAYRRRRTESRRSERERSSARGEALPPPEASIERAETLQRVVDAVRALEEPYRATILARFYEDMPPRAIASRDGIPVQTVHTRLKRGLAQLREQLRHDERDWRAALGLLADGSSCSPAPASVPATPLAALKLLAAATAAAAVLWGGLAVLERSERSPRTVAGREDARAAEPALLASTSPAPGREQRALASQVEPVLSGRVTDLGGDPVPQARVHVLGTTDPFGEADPSARILWDPYVGRTVDCDGDGRWRAVLQAPMRVLVILESAVEFEVLEGGEAEERWVEAPAGGVDFIMRRMPSGTIAIRVLEGASHAPVEDFRVEVYAGAEPRPGGGVIYKGGYRAKRAQGAVLRMPWRVMDPAGVTLHVVLKEPEVGGLTGKPERLEQELVLLPGATESVVFVLPGRDVLHGQVVDRFGAPVAEALVYFGTEVAARGDEPFKPLDPGRVIGGVRSGADGWFALRGAGEQVTVLHPGFSGETVDTARAGHIVLPPRGAIRGTLLGPGRAPAAGVELRLDRQRDGPATRTDAEGRFAFEGVERGTHAVWGAGEWPLACVRLTAGEERELELGVDPEATLTLALEPPDALGASRNGALAVGRDTVFDVRWWEGTDVVDGTLETAAPRPGTYWLVTDRGFAAPFDVAPGAERVQVELGGAELVVRGAVPSVQVVPADADPFLRLMAARLRVRLDREHGATFRLAPGSYLLVGEAGEELRALELPPEGLEVRLD